VGAAGDGIERGGTLRADTTAALYGPAGASAGQDAALAAWALARQLVTARPIFDALAEELTPRLPAATDDAYLRIVWAFARAGVAHPALLHAVVAALPAHLPRYTYAQRVLLLWGFATVGHLDATVLALADELLAPAALEAQRATLSLPAQQQVATAAAFLRARAPDSAAARTPLPDWLWREADRPAAPKEADPYDALYASISKLLKELRLPAVRQYAVDGYAIDIALPAARLGIEVVNKVPHLGATLVRAAAPAASLRRGHVSPAPSPAAVAAAGGRSARWATDGARIAAFMGDGGSAAAATAVPPPPPQADDALLPTLAPPAASLDALDANKAEYLAARGWRIVALDFGRWRGMDKRARAAYLTPLTTP